jgi:hypothetical protein
MGKHAYQQVLEKFRDRFCRLSRLYSIYRKSRRRPLKFVDDKGGDGGIRHRSADSNAFVLPGNSLALDSRGKIHSRESSDCSK